jgi:hypothetical protein
MPQAPSFEPFEYILEDERELPPERQAKFLLRPLKFREFEQIGKRTVSFDKGGQTQFDLDQLGIARKVLNFALLGWENFEGAPKFQRVTEHGRDIVPDHMLDLVAPWAIELTNAVTERSKLTEQSAKNSSAPSP